MFKWGENIRGQVPSKGYENLPNKKAQVTVFIIIGVVLIAGVVAFFALRDSVSVQSVPASIEPIYNSFLSCLENDAYSGVYILETQAGYIDVPDFESGSSYMPFSNHLDFLGNSVPYWYYVSGNGISKEQIPSKNKMEDELARFIEEEIVNCNLEAYYSQGVKVLKGDPEARVNIRDNEIEINLDMDLNVEKGEDNILIRNHNLEIKTPLGKLYESAKKIYEKEQDTLFLEEYAVDNLRLYAPVDGVELSCAPKVWVIEEVFDEMQLAIESNTLALKSDNGNFDLQEKNNKYFVLDLDVDEDVRFLNSRNWPYSFEVDPTDGNVLIGEPVGNQKGLGVLGFCYVPYHFVYNVKYPVLVQLFSGEDMFQFPMAVVLLGNNPREPLDASSIDSELPELCEYQNTPIRVNVYDMKMNSIDADISYECFGINCKIGETSVGSLEGYFPQCVNGYVLAKADGYKDAREMYSTTQAGGVDVFMDKLYDLDIDLNLGGSDYFGDAVISFTSDDFSKTVIYPEQKTVELSEGNYEIQVYIYEESSLTLAETKSEKCLDVPVSGVGGLFGLTKEECYDIEIPSQIVSNALAGGGTQTHYVLEDELEFANTIKIGASSLPTPRTLEQLQDNYILYENKGLEVEFR